MINESKLKKELKYRIIIEKFVDWLEQKDIEANRPYPYNIAHISRAYLDPEFRLKKWCEFVRETIIECLINQSVEKCYEIYIKNKDI